VLEGRALYEVGLAAGVTNAYPHLRHLVFSTTMRQSPDPMVEVLSTDPLEAIRELRAGDGLDMWIVGGGKLAYALLPEIDRLILKQHSSVIGSGTPLFNGPLRPHLFHPTDTRELGTGVRSPTFDRP
jgi:dihydrofolate reductase